LGEEIKICHRREAMRPLIISSRLQFAVTTNDGDGWLPFHRCSTDLYKVRPHLHAAAITSPEQYFSGTLCELSRHSCCCFPVYARPNGLLSFYHFGLWVLSDVIALVI
jgi:hypothetical protein